jgi:hypothetical protein
MRLWTIMFVIAILAILLGFGAARRIDHRSDMVEIIEIHDSDRALGLTESRRVWIKIGRALPVKLTGLLIRPRKVMDLSHGRPGASVFYLLPLEYVAAVIVALATTVAMLVNCLSRRRRRSRVTEVTIGDPHHGASTDCHAGAGP